MYTDLHEYHNDWLIAFRSEKEIEDELLALLCGGQEDNALHNAETQQALRKALRQIDELQERGEYECEVERLQDKIKRFREDIGSKPPSDEQRRRIEINFTGFDRVMDGLRSPDAEQRERFEAFFETIKHKHISELRHIFSVLEPVKKPRGRKRGQTYYDDGKLLHEMKSLVRNGSTVAAAARQVAEKAPNIGVIESGRKRIERAFRAKMTLRKEGD